MRPLALAFLLLVSSSLSMAQPLRSPSCRKNVIIYFDSSDTMTDPAKIGGTIGKLMTQFLEEALRSPGFLSESDSLKVKLFVDKVTDVWSSNNGEALTQSRKEEAIAELKRRIAKVPNTDTDYLELAKDFERELNAAHVDPVTTTYILVFSDFLYNPSKGKRNQAEWKSHSTRLRNNLVTLEKLFEAKQGKLVIWYQKNNRAELTASRQGDSVIWSQSKDKGDGVDLIDLFQTPYSHQMNDAAGIPQLVEAVSRELRQPLVIQKSESGFLFGRDGLKLNVAFKNPNCEQVNLKEVEVKVDRIGAGDTLAELSPKKVEEDISAGALTIVQIPLRGAPGMTELRRKFLDRYYDVTVSSFEDIPSKPRRLQLYLGEKAFQERVALAKAEAVVVRHLIPRLDRLFVRLKFAGNLLDSAILNANDIESEGSIRLSLIDPAEKEYTILPSTLGESKIFIFSLRNENEWSSSVPVKSRNLSLQLTAQRDRSDSAPELRKDLIVQLKDVIKYKDYRIWEWIILLFIFFLGVGIRVYYARQRI